MRLAAFFTQTFQNTLLLSSPLPSYSSNQPMCILIYMQLPIQEAHWQIQKHLVAVLFLNFIVTDLVLLQWFIVTSSFILTIHKTVLRNIKTGIYRSTPVSVTHSKGEANNIVLVYWQHADHSAHTQIQVHHDVHCISWGNVIKGHCKKTEIAILEKDFLSAYWKT